MNKILKFISLVLLIVLFQSNSFSKENFFNEAKDLFDKKFVDIRKKTKSIRNKKRFD